MLLQRKKKKELWRYASNNCTRTDDGMPNNQQQQPPLHQHQRRPPCQRESSTNSVSIPLPANYYNSTTNAINGQASIEVIQCNTPLPPYSVGAFGMEYSEPSSMQHSSCGHLCQREPPQYSVDAETETSTSATEELDYAYTVPYACNQSMCNFGDDCTTKNCERSGESNSTSFPMMTGMYKESSQTATIPAQYSNHHMLTLGNNFATTAASVFRNCCGCGFFSDSSNSTTIANVNTPSVSLTQTTKDVLTPFDHSVSSTTITEDIYVQDFKILMKQLKNAQLSALLEAVKSRKQPSSDTISNRSHNNCILIKRSFAFDEEPQVKTCRLFFWCDIKTNAELKRSPVCSSEQDTVYMCCNPLHWCRIVPRGSTSAFYDRQDSRAQVYAEDSKMQSKLWIRLPESQTTDGNDGQANQLVWCEVAYWELAQRVGARYQGIKSSFNIYNSGLHVSEVNEGMCLKSLADEKMTPTTPDVHNTRQKIGLGVTISRESDGIWLYNRSNAPIFLNSPTLRDSWSRAFKVMPGECLKAFDSIKAQTFDYSAHFPAAQLGPVDNNSMRISFAKGWGCDYKRQDITRCPCWLEIIFKQQR